MRGASIHQINNRGGRNQLMNETNNLMFKTKTKSPINSIIGLSDVNFHYEPLIVGARQGMNILMSRDERVKNLSAWDESILLISNNQRNHKKESGSENFGNNFIKGVTEADRSKLIRRVNTSFLRNQAQKGGVDFLEHLFSTIEFLHSITFFPTRFQSFWKKNMGKPSGPGALSPPRAQTALKISSSLGIELDTLFYSFETN